MNLSHVIKGIFTYLTALCCSESDFCGEMSCVCFRSDIHCAGNLVNTLYMFLCILLYCILKCKLLKIYHVDITYISVFINPSLKYLIFWLHFRAVEILFVCSRNLISVFRVFYKVYSFVKISDHFLPVVC